MRDIKFKYYWQHDDTGMIVSGIFTISDVEDGRLKHYATRDLGTMFGYHIGRSEYTGLIDINGTYIFEGDIVKSRFNNENVIKYVVEHDTVNPCFLMVGVHDRNLVEYDFWQVGLREIEVIGNIYENKELLSD